MDSQFDKGLAQRKQVMGADFVANALTKYGGDVDCAGQTARTQRPCAWYAQNNGATVAQIQEVLLHASIDCGVPCAVEAFRSAAEVVDGAGTS